MGLQNLVGMHGNRRLLGCRRFQNGCGNRPYRDGFRGVVDHFGSRLLDRLGTGDANTGPRTDDAPPQLLSHSHQKVVTRTPGHVKFCPDPSYVQADLEAPRGCVRCPPGGDERSRCTNVWAGEEFAIDWAYPTIVCDIRGPRSAVS